MASPSATGWSEIKPLLIPAEPFGYKSKAPKARFVLSQCFLLGDCILKKTEERAFERIQNPPPNATLIFRMNSASLLEAETKDLKQIFNSKPKVKKIQDLTRIEFDELQELTQRSIDVATEFFSNFNPIFSLSQTQEDVHNIILDTMTNFMNHSYRCIGLKQSDTPVAFTDKDFETFGIKKQEVAVNPAYLSCLQFTMLKAGELRAKEWIFQMNDVDKYLRGITDHLDKWGYKRVDEPQSGDLVIYFLGNEVQHIGRFLGPLVESKLGITNPYSHQHKIFALPPNHGDRVVFYRL